MSSGHIPNKFSSNFKVKHQIKYQTTKSEVKYDDHIQSQYTKLIM